MTITIFSPDKFIYYIFLYLILFVDGKKLEQDINILKDTSVTLDCETDNLPVEWRKDTISLSHNDRLLKITATSHSEYNCIVYDGTNATIHEKKFRLNVGNVPELPTNVVFLSNSSTNLYSSWKSNVNETIQLKLDGDDEKTINVSHPIQSRTFLGLQPYTNYSLELKSFNQFSSSAGVLILYNCTEPGIPSVSPVLEIVNVTSTTCKLKLAPNFVDSNLNITKTCGENLTSLVYSSMQGPFVGYYGTLYHYIEEIDHFEIIRMINIFVHEDFLLKDLTKASTYKLEVSLYNGKNYGQPTIINITTLDTIPEAPNIYMSNITSTSMTFYWSYDKKNSITEIKYQVSYCPGNESSQPSTVLSIDSNTIAYSLGSYAITGLESFTCYCIIVASVNSVGTGPYSNCLSNHTDFKKPEPVTIDSVELNTTDGKDFVKILWHDINAKELPHDQRSSLEYLTCYIGLTTRPNVGLNDIQTASTFEELNLGLMKDFFCYNTQDLNCTCGPMEEMNTVYVPVGLLTNSSFSRFEFTIQPVTKSRFESRYLRGNFANGHYIDLSHLKAFNQNSTMGRIFFNSKSSIFIVLGTILMIILLLCLFFIIMLMTKKIFCSGYRGYELSHHPENGTSLDTSFSTSQFKASTKMAPPKKLAESMTLYDPIPASELVDLVNTLHANENAGFQLEFEMIENASKRDWPAVFAKSSENVSKNRYSNVFPYDHSRVILKNPPSKKSNYINASYVDSFDKPNAYIAAQGPIPGTFDEFWQMVWEQNTRVIVMTSDFVERGRRKCDQYWPDEGKFQNYDNISVKLVSQIDLAFYSIRNFIIKNSKCRKNSKERTIYHYQYTDWRDFDVPISPLPVLKFIRITTQHTTENSGPIIVHCSAGVGRTGTYICIEAMIRQLISTKCINVKAFLVHIRQQRMKLVQTETQFAFIYDAIKEYILCPVHEVSTIAFPEYYQKLKNDVIENGQPLADPAISGDRVEEKAISFISPMEHQFMITQGLMENTYHSQQQQQDYLNFSHKLFISSQNKFLNEANNFNLHGYFSLNEYNIIADQPTSSESIDEFWRLVWDTNCPLIVILSEKILSTFWPDKPDDTMQIGSLRIAYCGKGTVGSRIIRYEFLLSSDREDYALGCHLWQFLTLPNIYANTNATLTDYNLSLCDNMMSKSTHTSVANGDEPIISSHLSFSNPNNFQLSTNQESDSRNTLDNVIDSELLRLAVELSHVSSVQIARNEKRSGNKIGAALGSTDAFGSTIVIDDPLFAKSGIFCALCVLLTQISFEKKVDIYSVVKMFHSQNPKIFKTYHELDLLYRYIELFLKDQSDYSCNTTQADNNRIKNDSTSTSLRNFTLAKSQTVLVDSRKMLMMDHHLLGSRPKSIASNYSRNSSLFKCVTNPTSPEDNSYPLIDFEKSDS